MGDDRAELQRRTERWFVRRGLPHFIDRYNAVEDVFTRAAVFLYLVFVLGVFGGLNLDWPLWANLLILAVSIVVVLGALALLNLRRGEPWYRRPRTIGAPELAGFVLIPAVLPILGGAHFREAMGVAVFDLAVLGVVYVVVGYGLLPMTRWAIGLMWEQFRNLLNLVLRALPLLLVFTMFMFINAELWKVATEIPDVFFFLTGALLVVLGTLLLVLRLPSETTEAAGFDHWSEIHALAASSPLAGLSVAGLADPPEARPLTHRARINVGLVLFFSQAVQILLVSLSILGFYVVLGLLVMQESTILLWTGEVSIDPLASGELFGQEIVMTRELLRSAGFVALIAGVQFVVTALSDESYRKEFIDDLRVELRASFAVRALYLERVVGPTASRSTSRG